jgi:hypothetical protein
MSVEVDDDAEEERDGGEEEEPEEDDFTSWSTAETLLLRESFDRLMPGGLCIERPYKTLPEIATAMNERARELGMGRRVYTTTGIWRHYNEVVRPVFEREEEELERRNGEGYREVEQEEVEQEEVEQEEVEQEEVEQEEVEVMVGEGKEFGDSC